MEQGFERSQVDKCVYTRGAIILFVYVDDAVLLSPRSEDLDEVILSLANPEHGMAFDVTDEGDIEEYLGVKVERMPHGAINLSQPQLIA